MENSCKENLKQSSKKWVIASLYPKFRRNLCLRSTNADLYHYAGNNPVRYIDPDGLYDTLSEEGKNFIKAFEGFSETIYDAKNPNHKYTKGETRATGDWTIGYGHQLTENELSTGVYNDGITEEEASALFDIDSRRMVEAVNNSVMHSNKLSQNQLDALVSFSYSVGENGFKKSKIKKMLDSNGYVISMAGVVNSDGFKQRVSDAFRWYFPPASNHLHTGLKKRRYNEIQMFLYSDYTIDDMPSYIVPRWPIGTIIKKGEQ